MKKKEGDLQQDETKKLEIDNLFVKLNLKTQPLPVMVTSDDPVGTAFQTDELGKQEPSTFEHSLKDKEMQGVNYLGKEGKLLEETKLR